MDSAFLLPLLRRLCWGVPPDKTGYFCLLGLTVTEGKEVGDRPKDLVIGSGLGLDLAVGGQLA